ncbi:unnamed protein product [Moneuplotes crassus]|uniref:Uncharacterized protein n=1 Tax=Euplotes crassus TaxID=5936 RepID=A0AAD1XWI5_EUPCR|nr:unnamed protein product [Moneuplotes crassus]
MESKCKYNFTKPCLFTFEQNSLAALKSEENHLGLAISKLESITEKQKDNPALCLELLGVLKHLNHAHHELKIKSIEEAEKEMQSKLAKDPKEKHSSNPPEEEDAVTKLLGNLAGTKLKTEEKSNKDEEFQALMAQVQKGESDFKSNIKKGRKKRAGSDDQYDNVEFQEKIENNILNVFEKMISQDKESKK